MKNPRLMRIVVAVALALTLVAGTVLVVRGVDKASRTHIVAYFDNTNGLFTGDEVRIIGVPVGNIDTIEPEPDRVKVTFWVDDQYKVPSDAKAAILSPQLITSRAIQLTPAYTGGPVMKDGAVIPQERTAVPIEWDDLRQQLQKLTDALQPTRPGGVSTLGGFVNTAADNLRDNGANIHDAIVKMSQAFSILGDHSGDTFSTIKNLSVVVSALQDSTTVMRQLNQNLAAVTALVADDPAAVGKAVRDLNSVVGDATSFIADNREALGTTTDKLSSISQVLATHIGDIKQSLHLFPTSFQNFVNIYRPAQSSLSGYFPLNNFNNPLGFLCGAIQAASRLGAEQSAKLCVQYLAPILKNRQYNFPPLGENLISTAMARPNELTYSQDWMRPDFVPPLPAAAPSDSPPPIGGAPLAAEANAAGSAPGSEANQEVPDQVSTNPAAGLPGMMVPTGAGS